jgi:propionyl-CoA carboxylase beta chain/acetyl-CoA/propionyl-CoA carboxylase carboxyl transferase subunit
MDENDSPERDGSKAVTAEDLLERVQEAKRAVADEGRPEAVERQHAADKLTARERIDYLCDEGSFAELGQLAAPSPTTPETADWDREDAPADGIVTGTAELEGRPVGVGATDFTVKGGSIGHTGGRKFGRLMELALRRGFPLVFLHDGGGHRIQEGLDARPFAEAGNRRFERLATLSGWVPIVSAIMGPGFAGPTNYAAVSDFVLMVEGTSTMGIAGPAFVEAALGEQKSKEAIGGPRFHTTETGMADRAWPSDEACLDAIRSFLSYLPTNANREPPQVSAPTEPYHENKERLREVVPADTKKAYDMHDIIEGIVDKDSFFELKPSFARNILTGLGHVDGRPVGLIGNNPRIMAGTIDANATDKATRFISLCDAFDLPIVFLTDVPGFLPGTDSEKQGLARRSGKFLFEISRATVPLINVVTRRGYGLAFYAMAGGRSVSNELTIVWPTAEIAAMGIDGAVDIIYRNEIESADDPEERRQEIIDQFAGRTGPMRAAESMGIDAVIDPAETRSWVRQSLERAPEQYESGWPPKKHGINPL